jgi:RimJ/RimL family protein N-acetyltransferase
MSFCKEKIYLHKLSRDEILGIIEKRKEFEMPPVLLSELDLTENVLRELKIKSEQLLRQTDTKWYDGYLIVREYDHLAVGLVGFTGVFEGAANIAFYTSHNFEGLGYASDAVALMLESVEADDTCDRLLIDHIIDASIGTIKVAERNDFILIDEDDDLSVYERKM